MALKQEKSRVKSPSRRFAEQVEKAWAENVGDDAAWETRLREAVEAANNKIVQYGKDYPESAGLGATIVAVLVRAERLTLAWVGDSRVYLFERGELCQLSHDHSLVSRLVEIGQLTPEEGPHTRTSECTHSVLGE